jgi:hypothetical protein
MIGDQNQIINPDWFLRNEVPSLAVACSGMIVSVHVLITEKRRVMSVNNKALARICKKRKFIEL